MISDDVLRARLSRLDPARGLTAPDLLDRLDLVDPPAPAKRHWGRPLILAAAAVALVGLFGATVVPNLFPSAGAPDSIGAIRSEDTAVESAPSTESAGSQDQPVYPGGPSIIRTASLLIGTDDPTAAADAYVARIVAMGGQVTSRTDVSDGDAGAPTTTVGDGTTTQRLVPTAVSGGGSWKLVAVANVHTCAVKSDDTLHCWGDNWFGKLGDGTTTQRLVPTAISGGGSWQQVATGFAHTCAIKSDNTPHCWGWNSMGQLGDNSTTNRLVPTAVSGGGNWKQVTTGADYACAVSIFNTSLYCWGSNYYGQITETELSTPYRLTGVQTLCGSPAGKAGEVVFNSSSAVMQYCDGVGWVGIGK